MDEIPADVLGWAQRLAAELDAQDGFERVGTWALGLHPGSGRGLQEYWVHGEGAAKIRWGTDGSFARCQRHLRKYVRDSGGLCAKYHHEATGEWPTEHGKAGIPS
jgi:hypothetical protein